jgi:hypothetical protein
MIMRLEARNWKDEINKTAFILPADINSLKA